MNRLGAILGLGIGAAVITIMTLGFKPTTVRGADEDSLWKPFLAADDFNKLVESEIKAIHDELSKPKPDAHKVKGSAILIALAAQNGKEGDAKPIRDTALQLLAAAEKPQQAKALADNLAKMKQPKGASATKAEPVDWKKHIEDLKDAMDVFGLPNKGGQGVERDLINLGGQRKPFTPAQMSDKLVLLAFKTALIAEVAKAHEDQGEKKKKEWLRLTDDMRRYSLELADTVKAKKAKETKTVLNKLNTSCNDCHTTFRDK
jgi:hypothetical protein